MGILVYTDNMDRNSQNSTSSTVEIEVGILGSRVFKKNKNYEVLIKLEMETKQDAVDYHWDMIP